MSTDRSARALAAVFCLVAAGLLAVNQAVRSAPSGDWLPAIVLFALFVGFASLESPGTDLETALQVVREPTAQVEAAVPRHVEAPKIPPDDLERIIGIGPKYRDALRTAGIKTFEHLASASVAELEAAVQAAGLPRSASIHTWAEQARLAAKNDWEGLNALQEALDRGRRI
jgi:predicted flap endonuclease-1-like 5' DNA nuclease